MKHTHGPRTFWARHSSLEMANGWGSFSSDGAASLGVNSQRSERFNKDKETLKGFRKVNSTRMGSAETRGRHSGELGPRFGQHGVQTVTAQDLVPPITASGCSKLSVWLLRQYWEGWKFSGTTPLLVEATSFSSRWHHMFAKSTSYSWSKDTWVAACFSPEHTAIEGEQSLVCGEHEHHT